MTTSTESYLKFREFFASRNVETMEVCCPTHKKALVEIVKGKSITLKQLNFARAIVTNKLNHSDGGGAPMDMEKVFEVKCTHYQCETMLTGTRLELGATLTRCELHPVSIKNEKEVK